MITSTIELKTCSKCGEAKPIETFQKDPRYTGGYRTHCFKCRNEYASQHGVNTRAKRTAQSWVRYWKRRGVTVHLEQHPNLAKQTEHQVNASK